MSDRVRGEPDDDNERLLDDSRSLHLLFTSVECACAVCRAAAILRILIFVSVTVRIENLFSLFARACVLLSSI